jgi:TPR repeat protein
MATSSKFRALFKSSASGRQFQEGLAAIGSKDYETARKLLLPLAERGNSDAQHNIGVFYDNGWGVEQDYAEAVKWYRKAVAQGNPGSQNSLGILYATGNGVAENQAEAVKLFRKAAGQGDAGAQCNLGVSYAGGHGVKQDPAAAYFWYSLCYLAHSDPDVDARAAEGLEDAERFLTPKQKAEIDLRVREWKPGDAAYGET